MLPRLKKKRARGRKPISNFEAKTNLQSLYVFFSLFIFENFERGDSSTSIASFF
jgi:hypothetical protein